jgi:hypothetical protein
VNNVAGFWNGVTTMMLPGGSHGLGINSYDNVVGDSTDGRALLWENGVKYDLNEYIPANSGWVLRTAIAINDSGMIAGEGLVGGHTRGFLLTPVPEPTGMSVLLIALCACRRRRRRCFRAEDCVEWR